MDLDITAATGTAARVEVGTGLALTDTGAPYYVATDLTVHQMYTDSNTGQWTDFNITAGTGTAARVEPGTNLSLYGVWPYYVSTDLTVHTMYVSGGKWIDLNITAATGTAARVEAGTSLALSNGSPYYESMFTAGTGFVDGVMKESAGLVASLADWSFTYLGMQPGGFGIAGLAAMAVCGYVWYRALKSYSSLNAGVSQHQSPTWRSKEFYFRLAPFLIVLAFAIWVTRGGPWLPRLIGMTMLLVFCVGAVRYRR